MLDSFLGTLVDSEWFDRTLICVQPAGNTAKLAGWSSTKWINVQGCGSTGRKTSEKITSTTHWAGMKIYLVGDGEAVSVAHLRAALELHTVLEHPEPTPSIPPI